MSRSFSLNTTTSLCLGRNRNLNQYDHLLKGSNFQKQFETYCIHHLSNPAMPSSPVCSRRKYGKRDSTAASMLDSSGAAFLMFLHMQDLEGVDIDHLVVRWTTHIKTRRREARSRQGRAGTLLRADIRQTCVPCLFIICSSRASKSQKPGLK